PIATKNFRDREIKMAEETGGSGHGGARPGAGRKPREPAKIDVEQTDDPMEFLLAVMNNPDVDGVLRVRAATSAARLRQERAGVGAGKKGEQKRAAEDAARGRF